MNYYGNKNSLAKEIAKNGLQNTLRCLEID